MAMVKTRVRAHYHFCDTITMAPFDSVARTIEFEMDVDPSSQHIDQPIEFEARNRIATEQRENQGGVTDDFGHIPWIAIDQLCYQAASEPRDENWFILTTMNLYALVTSFQQAYLTAMDGWKVTAEMQQK